jgi:hypothetical protein
MARLARGFSRHRYGFAVLVVTAVAVFVWPKVLTPRRSGWRVIANAATLGSAFLLTEVVRQRLPTDWPLAVVGIVLPLFIAAQLGLDWPPDTEVPGS